MIITIVIVDDVQIYLLQSLDITNWIYCYPKEKQKFKIKQKFIFNEFIMSTVNL